MAEQDDPSKLVVFNFLQYLAEVRQSDKFKDKDTEGFEVVTSCLVEAFGIDLQSPEQQKAYSIKPMSLASVVQGARILMTQGAEKRAAATAVGDDPRWAAFLQQLQAKNYFTAAEGTPAYQQQMDRAKTMFAQKFGKPAAAAAAPAAAQAQAPAAAAAAAAAAATHAPAASATSAAFGALSAEERKKRVDEAEKYKTEGNQKLSDRNYAAALEAYSKAIELNPNNPIYYGNRAAAYEFLGNSEKAIADCNESLRLDPNYAKAYSRLGLSYFSLGCYKDAVESYRKAVELDKGNAAYRESLNKAELKLAQHPEAPTFATRGAKPAAAPTVPAAAAGGGMPQMPGMPPGMPPMDPEAMKGMMSEMGGLSGIMSNPAFLGMAQKMMSDPQFMNMAQQMMSNPEMAQMLGNLAPKKQ